MRCRGLNPSECPNGGFPKGGNSVKKQPGDKIMAVMVVLGEGRAGGRWICSSSESHCSRSQSETETESILTATLASSACQCEVNHPSKTVWPGRLFSSFPLFDIVAKEDIEFRRRLHLSGGFFPLYLH